MFGLDFICILSTLSGTERCNEALQKIEKKYDIVVNIQGDEPLLEPEIIDGIVNALQVKVGFSFSCKANCYGYPSIMS